MKNGITAFGVRFRPGGVAVPQHNAFGEYETDLEALTEFLRMWEASRQAILAQLIDYGMARFELEAMAELVERLDFREVDVVRGRRIGLIPARIREKHPVLGDKHWIEIARGCETEEEMSRWAATCVSEQLSPAALRSSISRGRVMLPAENKARSGNGAGVATLQSAAVSVRRWRKQAEGAVLDEDAMNAMVGEARRIIEELEAVTASVERTA